MVEVFNVVLGGLLFRGRVDEAGLPITAHPSGVLIAI